MMSGRSLCFKLGYAGFLLHTELILKGIWLKQLQFKLQALSDGPVKLFASVIRAWWRDGGGGGGETTLLNN